MNDENPWSVRATDDGSPTLFHAGVGQACHSRAGAWSEAREVYARAARLRERARGGELAVCRLLDVGTGAAWNLAAALEALAGTGCQLVVHALESDPRVIETAASLAEGPSGDRWPHWRAACRSLREALGAPDGRAALHAIPGDPTGTGRVRLAVGDGRETLPALLAAEPELEFDAVFLDAFSPDVAPELWEAGFLARIAGRMASGSLLATYSAASRVRLRLALAGLAVGRGPGIGAKSEATLASPDRALEPLPPRAAANLARALAEHGEGALHAKSAPRGASASDAS